MLAIRKPLTAECFKYSTRKRKEFILWLEGLGCTDIVIKKKYSHANDILLNI